MNSHPVRRMLSAPRTRGLALTGAALALLMMFCLQLAASNQAAWQAVLAPGPASLDQALAAGCGSLALAIALWLAGALLLCLLAALVSESSALSKTLAGSARVVAPRVLRNAVAALLGATIAATPAIAVAAGERVPRSADLAGKSAAVPIHSPQERNPDGDLSPVWTGPSLSTNIEKPSTRTVGDPRPELFPGWIPGRSPDTRSAPARAQAPRSVPSALQPTGSAPPSTRPVPLAGESALPTGSVPMSDGSALPTRRANRDRPDEVVVRQGDTLWSLAERRLGPGATNGEIADEWPHWFTANRSVIGSDPDRLVPGERLRPPERSAHAATETHTPTGAQAKPGAHASNGAHPQAEARGVR